MNLWNQKNVPHKGWICDGIDDLGEWNYTTCQMCGNERVRFVHLMSHSDYEGDMMVGCLCAAKMENDYVAAKKRDKEAKSLAAKRKNWLSRKWRVSKNGNDYVNYKGNNMGVFGKGDRWKFWVNRHAFQTVHTSKDAAKLALFDFWVKG